MLSHQTERWLHFFSCALFSDTLSQLIATSALQLAGSSGVVRADMSVVVAGLQDMSYQNSWSWFLKPRAQAKEKKLLENFHAVRPEPAPSGLRVQGGFEHRAVRCISPPRVLASVSTPCFLLSRVAAD